MDITFLTGAAAFISAILIFCGSVWLLLTMVLGARLAYFISATITLAFVLIMGVVWAFTNKISPLGPVGELPSWSPVSIGSDVSEFGYPEGEWFVANENDDEQSLRATEFESEAGDYLETAIEEEAEGVEFEALSDAVVNSDETRLIEVDGDLYGGTVFEPGETALEGAEGDGPPDPVFVFMSFDPGNPLSKARYIFLGTLILFVLHMFGLSRAERKTKRHPAAEVV